jgi:hypothetical protein
MAGGRGGNPCVGELQLGISQCSIRSRQIGLRAFYASGRSGVLCFGSDNPIGSDINLVVRGRAWVDGGKAIIVACAFVASASATASRA